MSVHEKHMDILYKQNLNCKGYTKTAQHMNEVEYTMHFQGH